MEEYKDGNDSARVTFPEKMPYLQKTLLCVEFRCTTLEISRRATIYVNTVMVTREINEGGFSPWTFFSERSQYHRRKNIFLGISFLGTSGRLYT